MYGQKYGRKIGKAAQNREKQEWAKEKPKLGNARKLKYIKNARKIGKTYGSSHVLEAGQTAF